jgi:hypothetical protein
MNAGKIKTVTVATSALMSVQRGLLRPKCACGGTPGPTGECLTCRRKPPFGGILQPKLPIGQPGDRFEQEADRIADEVMRTPEPGLHRHLTPEGEEKFLQTKPPGQRRVSGDGGSEAPPIVQGVLRSSGHPLGPATRRSMESRFGHDFGQVRVYADAKAAASAQAINARAYTVGQDMVFDAGQYAPRTTTGKWLLAHELTHVMQQRDRRSLHLQKQPSEAEEVPTQLEGGSSAAGSEVTDEERAVPTEQPAQKPRAKQNPCTRTILAEGTCEFLATHSAWVCCDPDKGFKRPGKKTSKADPGKTCASEKWTPLFTCDNTCDKQLEKGCDDNDNWMAIPNSQFSRSKCSNEYTICANGKQTKAYVRDRSVTATRYEVSPGIQTTLGVKVGGSFKGAIYRPGAKQEIIDKDSCCKQ